LFLLFICDQTIDFTYSLDFWNAESDFNISQIERQTIELLGDSFANLVMKAASNFILADKGFDCWGGEALATRPF